MFFRDWYDDEVVGADAGDSTAAEAGDTVLALRNFFLPAIPVATEEGKFRYNHQFLQCLLQLSPNIVPVLDTACFFQFNFSCLM